MASTGQDQDRVDGEAQADGVEQEVLFDVDGHVATLTINRPNKVNTITVPMGYRIRDLLREVDTNHEIRVLIVTGAGERAFSAGTDISVIDQYGSNWEMRNREFDYGLIFGAVRKPVIAAIRGYCVGGGLEIALMSDIRIATPSSNFAAGEVKLGWNGGSGQTQLLPRLVGYGQAAKMLLTGEMVGGVEAHRIGLADELVEETELMQRAQELAGQIARNPPIAVQVSKQAIRVSMSTTLEMGLAYENQTFSYCMLTEDSKEGIAAFLEKREPHFKGR
jgi:enoyl-CoA hydratase